ncbi:adrenodoxin-like [Carcharodon carcharias]|uniref:adrenodoxin-like n=1 Tax=Carcharodon carcharias TaxID=13397 RepID=UPI001B7ED39E|nr:adrenodoxin-like [Carcharodon carcharias]
MAAMVSRRFLLTSSQNAVFKRLQHHDCSTYWGPRCSRSGSRGANGVFLCGRVGSSSSEVWGRHLLSTAARLQSSTDKVTVDFINRDGEKLRALGNLGDSLLDVVIDNNLDIDGFGACEGTLACSTCHLIFEESIFKKLDSITDEEMDMLDLAYGLTERSRLGCQICLKKWMDGMTVEVPNDVADVRQTKDFGSGS